MDNIGQFLADISQTYPVTRGVNAEKVIEDARVYLIGKLHGKELDLQKAKNIMFDSKNIKTFPKPNVLYDILHQCEIKNYHTTAKDGELIVITLPNGAIYSFTVSGIGKPLEHYKEDIKKKYGTCDIKFYPKGSVLNGRKVITPEGERWTN